MSFKTLKLGKRVFIRFGIATTFVATGQALWYRRRYENSPGLPLPSGPMKGMERCIEQGIELVRHTIGREMHERSQISQEINSFQSVRTFFNKHIFHSKQLPSETNAASSRRKLKLLILGDSLVRGVGCDGVHGSSPVLPRVLAQVLSLALRADVEWRAEGHIGATVHDIHNNCLPIICEEFLHPAAASTEFVIILICGLNDWKTMLTQFPLGSGPSAFRTQLASLVADIKDMAGSKSCKVYLPALPMICGADDPNCILQRAPLKYFIDFICSVWDAQKRHVAEDSSHSGITFIDAPVLGVSYATPGEGNVCSDGVHPSSKGYLWWATHIAHAIIDSHAAADVSR
eukprot:gene8108-16648_t